MTWILALLLAACALDFSHAAESIVYLHSDVSGSPVAATDANGSVLWREDYRPFGERLKKESPAQDNRQGFHGKPQDTYDLQYYGSRYYDPVLGRFLGVDPVGYDERSVHSFNRYAYANNNPYRYRDPDGNTPLLLLIPVALKVVDMAITAYDLHSAYQEGGAGGLLAASAQAAAMSVIPGGKTAGAVVKHADEVGAVVAKGGQAAFIVTPRGVAIPTNPAELKSNLSLLKETSTNPASSRKFVGEDSIGPLRVRVEKGHPADPSFTGKPDPLHTIDHLHIDRRENGANGPWSSQEKTSYGWPF